MNISNYIDNYDFLAYTIDVKSKSCASAVF